MAHQVSIRHGRALSLIARVKQRVAPGPLALLALLGVLVAYPLALLVATSFKVTRQGVEGWGLDNYMELLQHLNWVGNSLLVAVSATLLATVMAVGMAWILNRTAIPGRSVFETLIVMPYYMPPLIGGLAWSALGSPNSGVINKAWHALTGSAQPLLNTHTVLGIIWVMAIFEMPAAYLMVAAAMRGMDPSLEEASGVLGGSKLTTALRVTLPLVRPAILGAGLFLFSTMMGAFAIPAVLGTRSRFYVVTTAIYQLFQGYPPNYPLTAALSVALLLFTALALGLYNRALGKGSYSVITGRMYRPRRLNMGRWTPLLVAICCLYVLVGVMLPLGVLAYASIQPGDVLAFKPADWTLEHYRFILFEYQPTRQALMNSLLLGAMTGTLGVVVAGLVAWVVTRTKGPGRWLLEHLSMFPRAVPGLVFSLGLLWAWLILPGKLYGTIWLLLLAYVTIFLPVAVRSLTGVMVQLDRSLEEAAQVIGAGWLRTTWTVTLPLLRPGILSAWMLLFIVSIREISASMLLSSPSSRVLGPAIYNFWESGGLARVSALSIIQTLVIMVALVFTRRAIERNL